jgi:hypothetical protein
MYGVGVVMKQGSVGVLMGVVCVVMERGICGNGRGRCGN